MSGGSNRVRGFRLGAQNLRPEFEISIFIFLLAGSCQYSASVKPNPRPDTDTPHQWSGNCFNDLANRSSFHTTTMSDFLLCLYPFGVCPMWTLVLLCSHIPIRPKQNALI